MAHLCEHSRMYRNIFEFISFMALHFERHRRPQITVQTIFSAIPGSMLNLDLDFCRVTALLRRSPGIQQPGSVMLQLVKLLLPSLKKALKYNQKEGNTRRTPHPFSNMNQGPRETIFKFIHSSFPLRVTVCVRNNNLEDGSLWRAWCRMGSCQFCCKGTDKGK